MAEAPLVGSAGGVDEAGGITATSSSPYGLDKEERRQTHSQVGRPKVLDTAEHASSSFVNRKESNPRFAFEYIPFEDPANQIRLLRIHSGSWDDDIISTMSRYERSAAPRYYAISYAWGDPLPLCAIFVNKLKLMVGRNCVYALQQARLHIDEDCLIWIDAICINQDDVAEKNCQVQIMGDIFQGARCVLACIGALTKSAEYLFDMAQRLVDEDCFGWQECSYCAHEGSREGIELDTHEFHLAHSWLGTFCKTEVDCLTRAYNDFGDIGYWSRLWVIQELCLANRVRILCGRSAVSLADLFLIHKIFRTHSRYFKEPEQSIAMDIYLNNRDKGIEANGFTMMCDLVSQRWRGVLDLRDNLHELQTWKCKDPRDRIYGLLNLLNWPAECGPPVPDYTLDPLDVALDVLNRLGQEWDTLYHVRRLLEGLDVDYEQAALRVSRRWSERLADGCSQLHASDRDQCSKYRGRHSPTRIAIQLDLEHIAVIYPGTDATLQARIRMEGERHLQIHVDLDTYSKIGCDVVIGKTVDSIKATRTPIILHPAVRAGDLLLELKHAWYDVPREGRMFHSRNIFLVVRQAQNDIYEIVGHAEMSYFLEQRAKWTLYPRSKCTDVERDRFENRFALYLSAEDAVAYVILGKDSEVRERLREDETMDSGVSLHINKPAERTRFSSYVAIKKNTHPNEAYMSDCVSSLNTLPCICADCGGLLTRYADCTTNAVR